MDYHTPRTSPTDSDDGGNDQVFEDPREDNLEDDVDNDYDLGAMEDDVVQTEENLATLGVEAAFIKATTEVPTSTAEKRKRDYENKGIKKKRIAHSNTEVHVHVL